VKTVNARTKQAAEKNEGGRPYSVGLLVTTLEKEGGEIFAPAGRSTWED